jgi:type II secretory pathway pseudopilin PulG
MLECLTVLTILVLLAVIVSPAVVNAKKQATIIKSMSNMSQLHVAAMLYQQEYEGVGGPAGIGLPLHLGDLPGYMRAPKEILLTGGTPYKQAKRAVYIQMFPGLPDSSNAGDPVQMSRNWSTHIVRTDGNPILIVDPSQNDCPECTMFSRLGLGQYLDGHSQRKVGRGSFGDFLFWETKN